MKVILKQFLHLLFDLAEKQQQQQANIEFFLCCVNTRVLPALRMTMLLLKEKRIGNFSALNICVQLQQCTRNIMP